MFRVRILFARYAAFLVLYLSLLNCNAKKNNHHCDNPSSCGSIHNISFPFRLESDPVSCGDSNYELACDNNDTLVLSLYSGKYYVQAIHYHNHTIRVVDAGVRKDNCSSTPLYYLIFQSHFSYKYPSPFYLSSYYTIIFLNCENPVRHPLYFDTAPCINGSVSSSSNSSAMSSMKRHSYVLLGNPKASDVADLCSIDWMLPTSIYFDPEKSTNVSYLDIHKWLAYGFELSWDSAFYSFFLFLCIFSAFPWRLVEGMKLQEHSWKDGIYA